MSITRDTHVCDVRISPTTRLVEWWWSLRWRWTNKKRRNAYYVTVHGWVEGGCTIYSKTSILLTYLFNLSWNKYYKHGTIEYRRQKMTKYGGSRVGNRLGVRTPDSGIAHVCVFFRAVSWGIEKYTIIN